MFLLTKSLISHAHPAISSQSFIQFHHFAIGICCDGWPGKAEEAGWKFILVSRDRELVYNEDRVVGVATNDVGLKVRSGQPKVRRYGFIFI